MKTCLVTLDGPPTPHQTQRAVLRLQTLESELSSIQQTISSEEALNIAACNAISNLEMALPQVQAAHRIHAEGLGHLQKFQAGVKQTEQIERLQMKEEKETSQLYEKFDSILSEYTSQSMGVIEGQVQLAQMEIRRLQDLHQNMEQELGGWKSSQDMAVSTLTYLNYTKDRLEADIRSTKATIHPIRRVPIDVWVDTFESLVEDEYFAYIRHNANHPLRPTAYILSHVCRLWRQILADSSNLWRILFTYPGGQWPIAMHSLCTDATHRVKVQPRWWFVTNLSYYNTSSTRAAKWIMIDEPMNPLPHPEYAVIVDMAMDDETTNLKNSEQETSNFQLDSYLPQTLTELYIRDNDATSLPMPTTNLQLPRLCVLGINYPAHGFLKRVEMRALKTLILYSYDFPGATPTTKPQAVITYGQLCNIRFEAWSQPKDIIGDSYYGAVGALSRLVQHMPALQSLTFDRSYVDGGALVELISRSKEKEAVEPLPKLDQLVLSYTEGITRDHCDELKKTLSQIKVFR
ncbi:hypothetical protein FRC17_006171 [Serendipita sp. 399]|nr:hypothetical protein FRC17_006171 [Serendipita sp. 399]